MIPHTAALHQILTAGIQAPSAENKHYFWLDVGTEAVTLHATDSASWSAQPDRKMLALMSYAAMVENITLRAQAMGFLTHASWHLDAANTGVDAPGSTRVVELRWQSAPPVLDPLDGAVSTRHTNRRFYERTPVQNSVLTQLQTAANSVPGTSLHWLVPGPQRSCALSLIRIAETERFRRAGLHHEMFSAIRFERGWDGTVLEGLPPAALQVEWPMRWPFAWLRHGGPMRAARLLGAHWALGLRSAYLPCALAPHIGLVMSNSDDLDTAHLQAGRAFERLWLAVETHGLALQPMAAATVLLQQNVRPDWVSAATQKRLAEGMKTLSAALGLLDSTARPCMLFRVGHAQAPTAVAGRRPLEYFLKHPSAYTSLPTPP
jgi:nitroreductase